MFCLRRFGIRAALAGCAAGGITATLHGGQCELVELESWGLAGTSGRIETLGAWDPDGPGPCPENLVVSGQFQQAGDLCADQIAMFDGERWHRLSSGLGPPNSGYATAIRQYGRDLVVGGTFVTAGGIRVNGIARWDGSNWWPMGTNLRSVVGMTEYDGALVACGAWADTAPQSTVLRWDGSDWMPFTLPISAIGQLATDPEGRLLVAGLLSWDGTPPRYRMARWDGTAWTQVGDDLPGTARSMLVHEDQIIVAGGGLATAPGQTTSRFVVRLDGVHWHSMVTSIDGPVCALALHDGQLFATGHFRTIDGSPIAGIARWDGTVWHALDQGLRFSTHASDVAGYALTTFRDALVVGGKFGQAGDRYVKNFAAWNGDWERIGGVMGAGGVVGHETASRLNAIVEYDGDLVFAGDVNVAADSRNVARRTVNGWIGVGDGLSFSVTELCNTSQGLLAAGESDLFQMGPLPHPVALLTEDSWVPLGVGQIPPYAIVWSAVEYAGEIVLAGELRSANELGEGDIRRWTGTEWVSVGPPTDSIVTTLYVHHSDLIAAGMFTGSNGESIRGIGRWNGTSWAPLGNSNDIPMLVFSLTAIGDNIYAAGHFDFGGGSVTNVAYFDGTTWHPIPPAFTEPVRTIVA